MADKEHKGKVIIKKVKKGGHAAHHGGSWKVAYADFVTAMMAFFLVMWLVNALPQEKREQIAVYFQSFSLFDLSGKPGLIPSQDLSMIREDNPPPVVQPLNMGPESPVREPSEAEKTAEEIKKEVEAKAPELKEQVSVTVEGDKVFFDLTEDAKGKPLFALGRADLTPDARKVLAAVAPKLNAPQGKLTVEGHTDAYTYAGERFTNWELSTDRASGARRELERAGTNPAGIVMVAGYAATRPFVPDNPYDTRNRRIRLVLEVPPKPGEAKPGPAKTGSQAGAKAQDNLFGKPQQVAPPPPPPSPIPTEKRDLLDRQMDRLYDEQTKGKL
jgi:chemotaxis protein MotB